MANPATPAPTPPGLIDPDAVVAHVTRARRQSAVATAILTANLTPHIADAVIALSRMGPRTRVYLIAPGALSQEQAQLVHLLETCDIETHHVSA